MRGRPGRGPRKAGWAVPLTAPLSSAQIFFGGVISHKKQRLPYRPNFRGCMENIAYNLIFISNLALRRWPNIRFEVRVTLGRVSCWGAEDSGQGRSGGCRASCPWVAGGTSSLLAGFQGRGSNSGRGGLWPRATAWRKAGGEGVGESPSCHIL